jgi:hypothetical protein
VDDTADFNVGKIDGKKFFFTPSTELKKQLLDLHFEADNGNSSISD